MLQGGRREVETHRQGSVPLATSCQVPLLLVLQSPLHLDKQLLPAFHDFPGFEARVVKAEKAGSPGAPVGSLLNGE